MSVVVGCCFPRCLGAECSDSPWRPGPLLAPGAQALQGRARGVSRGGSRRARWRLQQPSHERPTELFPPPVGGQQKSNHVPHLVALPPMPPVRPHQNLIEGSAGAVQQVRAGLQTVRRGTRWGIDACAATTGQRGVQARIPQHVVVVAHVAATTGQRGVQARLPQHVVVVALVAGKPVIGDHPCFLRGRSPGPLAIPRLGPTSELTPAATRGGTRRP